jgi:hypothetical protein
LTSKLAEKAGRMPKIEKFYPFWRKFLMIFCGHCKHAERFKKKIFIFFFLLHLWNFGFFLQMLLGKVERYFETEDLTKN